MDMASIDWNTKLRNVYMGTGRPKRRNLSFGGICLVLKLYIQCESHVGIVSVKFMFAPTFCT